MSSRYSAMLHRRARLQAQAQPIPRELWMAGDGMVYAQQPVLAYPALIKALLGLCLLGALWSVGYLAWVVRAWLHV
jgi:hypothetical protein